MMMSETIVVVEIWGVVLKAISILSWRTNISFRRNAPYLLSLLCDYPTPPTVTIDIEMSRDFPVKIMGAFQ